MASRTASCLGVCNGRDANRTVRAAYRAKDRRVFSDAVHGAVSERARLSMRSCIDILKGFGMHGTTVPNSVLAHLAESIREHVS